MRALTCCYSTPQRLRLKTKVKRLYTDYFAEEAMCFYFDSLTTGEERIFCTGINMYGVLGCGFANITCDFDELFEAPI